MPVARSTTETFDYVTLADRELPKDQQTTFHLRRMSTSMMMRMRDLRDGTEAQIGRWLVIALRAGIAGWTNFVTPAGDQVPFTKDAKPVTLFGITLANSASEASVDALTTEDAQEIGAAIMRGNELAPDDLGN